MLLAANINVILREIDLKSKPKELYSVSKKGTVPVLITADGKIIDESIDIMKWAYKYSNCNNLEGNKIQFLDSNISSLIDENDNKFKYFLDKYKYCSPSNKNIRMQYKSNARAILIRWNNLIMTNNKDDIGWLAGRSQSLADCAIWPFVRQYSLIDKEDFNNDYLLKDLKIWLNYYLSHNHYKELMHKVINWDPNQKPIYFPCNIKQ